MKGLELPVNTLVVIAIAVLVMLGLIAMYMAGAGGGTIIAETSAKSASCNRLVQEGCADGNLANIPIDWAQYASLGEYCLSKYAEANPDLVDIDEDATTVTGQITVLAGSGAGSDFDIYCRTVVCNCPGVVE